VLHEDCSALFLLFAEFIFSLGVRQYIFPGRRISLRKTFERHCVNSSMYDSGANIFDGNNVRTIQCLSLK
jgi:hypothetical protein